MSTDDSSGPHGSHIVASTSCSLTKTNESLVAATRHLCMYTKSKQAQPPKDQTHSPLEPGQQVYIPNVPQQSGLQSLWVTRRCPRPVSLLLSARG